LVGQFFSALPAFPAFRICHVCEGMSHLFTPFSAIQAEGIGRVQKLATLLTPDRTEQFRLLAKTPLKDPVGSVVSEGGPCCELPVALLFLTK
jgi:hypothetical protein